MRKLIMLSLVFLLVLFTSASSLAADYHVRDFWIETIYDSGDSKAEILFELIDYEAFNLVWKDVVDYVDISIDDVYVGRYCPTFHTDISSRFIFTDRNGNGRIDHEPWLEEKTNSVGAWPDYYITLPASLTPHPGGIYSYIIHFNDGSTLPADPESDPPLTADVPEGLTADEWPPVTIISVDMDETTGELTIEWDLPAIHYSPDEDVRFQIRMYCYDKTGDYKYYHFRVNVLNPLLKTFTLGHAFADILNSNGANYFDIQFRVSPPDYATFSRSSRQVYAIKGYKIKLKKKDLWSKHIKRIFKKKGKRFCNP